MAENKKTKEEVKIEAEAVLDCLDWDILIMTKDFKVLFANKTFLNKIGMDRSGAIGQCCYKITHHIDQPCQPPHDPCPLEEMLKTNKPTAEIHTHFTKNNEKFLASTIVAPLEGFGQDAFLHVSMPMEKVTVKSAEVKPALDKALYILNVVNLYQKQMQEMKTKSNEVTQMKSELEMKIEELEKFNNLVVGRELKMMELKKKIQELEEKCAQGKK